MTANTKYLWKLGAPLPVLQQHSAVKHKIIQSYVRDYIMTLMKRASIPKLQLTLVDGFSGGGCYLDEGGLPVDGSPLLMMRAVQEARAHLNLDRTIPRDISADYEFIDICPDTVEYLRYWLNGRTEEGIIPFHDAQRARIQCGDFLKELPRLIDTIRRRKMGERAIFVLDQYNYYDLPLPYIKQILHSLKSAEVILTFNVGAMITFLSDRAANRKPVEHVGLDKYIPWEDIKQIKAEEQQTWRRTLQRYIAHGIRQETGAHYATLFFVKPHGLNKWDYWLIHLSKHYKAHEVMKDLHWQHATEFGHELEPGVFIQGYDANQDQDYTGQDTFDFGKTSRVVCVDGLREHFGHQLAELRQPIPLGQLIYACASQSPGSTQHFLEAAKLLHHSNDVIITGADGRKRQHSKHYHLDDVIEFSPQIRLI